MTTTKSHRSRSARAPRRGPSAPGGDDALYKRLFSLGLWQHIRSVGGNREKGIGGAYFVTHDNRAVLRDLIGAAQFCKDSEAGSILHTGGISLREVGQPGLHIEWVRTDALRHLESIRSRWDQGGRDAL